MSNDIFLLFSFVIFVSQINFIYISNDTVVASKKYILVDNGNNLIMKKRTSFG
ncbi:hypothetical protein [Clostridium sp. OS1-26]|uniref:hypothetical protein n=1 Tax=Clostridium sp. OS1-26 TaxID=3070681 RepID=UPI0027E13E5B|nr:hypothetical protein [Clostridium sp. OS1-26]WML36190.1 hypothetical protein RCG18_05600 [Clostridium sp. OS1-26]